MQFTAVVFSAHIPSCAPFNIGVLVVDKIEDRTVLRFGANLDCVPSPADREVLANFPAMVESMADEMRPDKLLRCLESMSNAIRVSDPLAIDARDVDAALELLSAEYLPKS